MKKLLIIAILIFPLLTGCSSQETAKEEMKRILDQKICFDGIEYYKMGYGFLYSPIYIPRIVSMDEHLSIATVVKCEEK